MIRTAQDPATSDVLDLCCGGRKCPKLRDEGDAIVISDAEQTDSTIRFSKDDAPRVIAWLQARIGR